MPLARLPSSHGWPPRMPSKHKTPLLGWHPKSAELMAWVRAEAQRRGVPVARLLDEALEAYRAMVEAR